MIKQCECRSTVADTNWKQVSMEDFWLDSGVKVSFIIYKCKKCECFRGFPAVEFEKGIKYGCITSMEALEEAIRRNSKKSFWRSLWTALVGKKGTI